MLSNSSKVRTLQIILPNSRLSTWLSSLHDTPSHSHSSSSDNQLTEDLKIDPELNAKRARMNLWCRLESGTSSRISSSCNNQSKAKIRLSVLGSSLNLTPQDRTLDSRSSFINVSSRNLAVDVVVSEEVVVVAGSSVVVAACVVLSVGASDISSRSG